MYVKYGSYSFEPWEAGLAVRMVPNRTPRGMRKTIDIRLDISGEFCVAGQNEVNSKVTAMQEAFAEDYKDCGLMKDDDSPSVHYLINDNILNLSGNIVIYQQYPQTVEGEFASGRKFAIGVAAEVLDPDTSLLDYQDNIQIIGNAGPRYEWRWNPFWKYYCELESPVSLQRIVHQGYAVGLRTYVLPPPPFYAPPFEDNLNRFVGWDGPKRYAQGFSDYVTRWRYQYTLPIANDALRPTQR